MTQPITFPAPKFMGRGYDANAVDQWIEENYPPAVDSDAATSSTWPVDVENPEGVVALENLSDDERVQSLIEQNAALEVSRKALRKEATSAREERDEALSDRDQAIIARDEALEEAESLREQLNELGAAYTRSLEEVGQVQATASEQAEHVAELEELDAQDEDDHSAEVQALRTALSESQNALEVADEEIRALRVELEEAQREAEWTTPTPEAPIQVDPVMRSVEIITQAERVASEHIAESQRKRDQLEAEYESRKEQLTAEVEEHRAHLVDSIADLEAREDNMFGNLAKLVQDAKTFLDHSEEQLVARRDSMPQDRLTIRQ